MKITVFGLGYLQGNSINPLIGFYHLSEIPTAGNLRGSTMLDILRILQKEKFRIMIYEPLLKDISELHGLKPAESEDPASAAVVLENDLQKFKEACDLIAANRFDENLADVKEKEYTRDINNRA